ncbi:carboxypeptidase-like regulatory domain-containing protein [Paludibaculum fermentans]|uniref:carboxypeptidase-like regulatory domain-containing protein n=1 Tax=Paludibaculum fermentans TaxID=1473598 RepID=UPI003EB76758
MHPALVRILAGGGIDARRWPLLLACLAVSTAAACAQPGTYAFRGRVVDDAGGPVDGALISVERVDAPGTTQTRSAKNGRYSVPPVPDGVYSITAKAPGFVTVRYSTLEVEFPRVFEFDLTLKFGPITEGGIGDATPYRPFFGTLRRSGSALAGAQVCLLQDSKSKCTSTNSLGQYYLSVLAGAYTAAVEQGGTTLSRQRIEITGTNQNRIILD